MTTEDEFLNAKTVGEFADYSVGVDGFFEDSAVQVAWLTWCYRQQEIDVLKADIERLKEWTEDDQPLPEDDEIKTARPRTIDGNDLYAEAMRMVGAKRSKYALVDLVNWLLTRSTPPVQKAEPSNDEIRNVFLSAGFTIKPGQDDLKPYVYAAARALLSHHNGQPTSDHIADHNKMILPPEVIHCLRFYAHGCHYIIDPEGEGFDTVSGEPENWLHSQDDNDATMIENGGLARAVLRGEKIEDDPESQPIEGEIYGIAPTKHPDQCEQQLDMVPYGNQDALDAIRYRYIKKHIKEDYVLPGNYYLPDESTSWDIAIDASMRGTTDKGVSK